LKVESQITSHDGFTASQRLADLETRMFECEQLKIRARQEADMLSAKVEAQKQ